ncbi:MAG: hypothetical protein RR413_11705 [Christensenellaceae bacterium]
MFEVNKTFSHKGIGKVNEDVYFANHRYAWVFDGATGLTNRHITNTESDALWYTNMLSSVLNERIDNMSRLLSDILSECITVTWEKFLSLIEINELSAIDIPSAVGCVVRCNANIFEYAILGDCSLIVEFKDDNVICICDCRLNALDGKSLATGLEASRRLGIPLSKCKEHMLPTLIENRLKMNTPQGYYNFSNSQDAAQHSIQGSIPMETISRICICSDGFSQYYELFKLCKDCKEFIQLVASQPIECLYLKLTDAQKQDSEFENFPRLKLTDDATVVCLDVVTN